MPIEKLFYCNNLLKFSDVDELPIELRNDPKDEDAPKSIMANIFNWNSLYNIKYFGGGKFEILKRVADSPELKENEEYIIFYI